MAGTDMRERAKALAKSLPEPLERLLRRSYHGYQTVRERTAWAETEAAEFDERGQPLPPRVLRRLVSGWDDTEQWLRTGEVDSGLIRRLVEENGRPMDEMSAILDFACGCGRIARCWADLGGPRIYGCDYDPRLTGWCQSNLTGMEVRTNGADPPLPFEPESFDLVYAISLFTHLSAEAHTAWMRDVRRVLKPGGLFLFTAHGERFVPHLDDEQRVRFVAGDLVVLSPEISSQQACAAFHPKAFVRERLLPEAGLELVAAVYEDRSDGQSMSPMPLQDNYLARRPL